MDETRRIVTANTRGRLPALALILVAEDEKGWAAPAASVLRQNAFLAQVHTRPEVARGILAERRHRLLVLGSAYRDSPEAVVFTRELRRATASASRRAWVLAVCPAASTTHLLALRDAGVSAVLIGPVTIARVEERLQAMAGDRRRFVESDGYLGPDRRRQRDKFFPLHRERRADAPESGS